jgi:hypothetical protein
MKIMTPTETEKNKSAFSTTVVLAVVLLVVLLTCVPYLVSIALAEGPAQDDAADASPIFGVTIPAGYKQWELVASAEEAAPLDELRAVVGNQAAIDAYQAGKLPFPDGTILVKRAWKRKQSPEFAAATIPGPATTVQVMVKDSKNMPRPAAGALAASSTASRWTKRSTGLAGAVTKLAPRAETTSSRGSRRESPGGRRAKNLVH